MWDGHVTAWERTCNTAPVPHLCVIIIDERTVITGSYNFTGSAEHDNDENLVIIDDQAVARAYLDEFNQAYAQAQAPNRCR